MRAMFIVFLLWLWSSSIVFYFWYVKSDDDQSRLSEFSVRVTYESPEDFINFDNTSGTADGCYIVPNYVHFIRFNKPEFSFVDAVCALAALKHQKPEKIFFHTDVPSFKGKYWEVLLQQPGFKDVVEVKYKAVPTQVYGQLLNKGWRFFHGGDIARLEVLMKYGGIFLDNDSYIVKSLNEFRRFEMTLGWCEDSNLSNQIIIAHSKARFLREWLLTYKGAYRVKEWYYNAGVRPTQEVLLKRPELIHRMTNFLGDFRGIPQMIFLRRSDEWKQHYALHLLINHQYLLGKNLSSEATFPVKFTEENIVHYPINFYDMAREVYPLN